MKPNWHEYNWQNDNLSSRQVFSLVFSILLLLFISLIPLKFQILKKQSDNKITLIIVKPKPYETLYVAPKIIDNIKPEIKNSPVSKSIKKLKTTINKTAFLAKQKTKINLPSAGIIYNSMKGLTPLEIIENDFQAASNKFIFKNILKKEPTRLVADNTVLKKNLVRENPSFLKGVFSLFSPIEDQIKTQDTLNHCPTLGRRSVFCP